MRKVDYLKAGGEVPHLCNLVVVEAKLLEITKFLKLLDLLLQKVATQV